MLGGATQATPADFVSKWNGRFADNTFQLIRESTFREFAADVAEVFGVTVATVPPYQLGATYQAGFLVRSTPAGGQESFYYSLLAGKLKAPGTDPTEWKVVPGPTKATALSQEVSLVQAQGLAGTGVVPGRTYLVDFGLDANGDRQTIALRGVSNNQFAPEGTLEVAGELFGIEHVDVLAATFSLKADANPQGGEFVSQRAGTTSFQLGPQLRDVNALRIRRYTSAGLLATLPALPVPADAPNITAPGDVLLLPAAGTPVAGSPEISEHGETVEAGQSILVTGEQLAGATASVYVGGQLLEATLSGNTGQVVAVQLPTNAGAFGAYVLWLQNSQGYGEPVLLNRARATWMSTTLAAGVTGHVFGLNLTHGNAAGGASYLYLVHKLSGDVVAVPVLPDTIPERISFKTPAAPRGDYWVHVHNGHGDKWGWSERLSCTIVSASDHVQTHEWQPGTSVTNTGGNIAPALNAALLADSRANKYTSLSRGTWLAGEGIEIVSGCSLRGEVDGNGVPLTIITPDPARFDPSGDRGLLGSPAPKEMVRLENLLLDNSKGAAMGPVNRLVVLRRCRQVLLRNVWVVQPGGGLVRLDEDTHGLYIEKCKFRGGSAANGEPIFLLPSPEAQLFLSNTEFKLYDNADSALNASGVSQLAILPGCTVVNGDDTVLNGAFAGKGRYLKGSGAYGIGSECWHVEGSVGRNLGVMRDWLGTTSNPVLNATNDDNEGEGIMYEGAETRGQLPVVSATRTTITSSSKPTSDKFTGAAPFAHYAHIVRGRGMGQMRRIVANDGNGTLTFDKPWRVVPDATSLVMYGTYCRFVHVVDCDFSARPGMNGPNYSASKFLEVYGGCHKWRARRNKIKGFRSGLSTFTTQHNSNDFIDSCSHNDLADNLITDCRYGIRIEVTGEGGGGLPSGGGYPAPGQVALHLRNRIVNPVLYNTIIAAARTDDPTTATNFPYPLIAGLLIEGDKPVLPFPNDYRTTSNPSRFPVIDVGPTQLAGVVLATAAQLGVVLAVASSDELGPPEFLPPGASIRADGRLTFAASVQLHLYLLDWKGRLVPLARTLPTTTSTAPSTGYTDVQIDALLAAKQDAAPVLGVVNGAERPFATLAAAIAGGATVINLYAKAEVSTVTNSFNGTLFGHGHEITIADTGQLRLFRYASVYNCTISSAGSGNIQVGGSGKPAGAVVPPAAECVQVVDCFVSSPLNFGGAANYQGLALRGKSFVENVVAGGGPIYLFDLAEVDSYSAGFAVYDKRPGTGGGGAGYTDAQAVAAAAAALLAGNAQHRGVQASVQNGQLVLTVNATNANDIIFNSAAVGAGNLITGNVKLRPALVGLYALVNDQNVANISLLRLDNNSVDFNDTPANWPATGLLLRDGPSGYTLTLTPQNTNLPTEFQLLLV